MDLGFRILDSSTQGCLFLELVISSCLPRLTTNVSYGFTLVLDMSKSFAFSNSKRGGGGHIGSKGEQMPPPPPPQMKPCTKGRENFATSHEGKAMHENLHNRNALCGRRVAAWSYIPEEMGQVSPLIVDKWNSIGLLHNQHFYGNSHAPSKT